MKTNKPNHYKETLEVFNELKTLYPGSSLGKHIATIADEYGDIWGISDKEFLFALKKYKAQLELYSPSETDEKELEEIIKGGMNLSASSLLNTEED